MKGSIQPARNRWNIMKRHQHVSRIRNVLNNTCPKYLLNIYFVEFSMQACEESCDFRCSEPFQSPAKVSIPSNQLMSTSEEYTPVD